MIKAQKKAIMINWSFYNDFNNGSRRRSWKNPNFGSMIKVYAADFAMCAYIRYLGKQEEYDLLDVVERDNKHVSLFILQKLKDSI